MPRPSRSNVSWWLALACLASACSKKAEAPAAAPAPEVPIAEVVQKDVPLGMELVGQLSGLEDVQIRARVEGYLRSIDYREGARVKKGDLLFTIDDLPFRAEVAQAQARLATAESTLAKYELDVKRFTPLAQARAISQAELDNAVAMRRSAQSNVQAQRALLEQARLNLGYTRVASPVSGLAGRAERKVGDLVGRGESTLLTTVSSVDPIRVSIAITEADYLRFARPIAAAARTAGERKAQADVDSRGSSARLELADGSTYPEPGKVLFVDRAVDPTTGTLRVDVGFPNPDGVLRPGQYGKLRFTSETRKGALLVPQRAVQEIQGTYFVYVVGQEDKVETRKVKPGPRLGELWLIEEGLKPGERAIVAGTQRLKDGMVVRPVAAGAPQAAGGEGKGASAPQAAAEGK
jgi:membrane fusion protein (multidrug efflux system)